MELSSYLSRSLRHNPEGKSSPAMGILPLLWLVSLPLILGAADGQPAAPILINCGSNSTIDADGRTWVGDFFPGSNVTLRSSGVAASAMAVAGKDPLVGSLYRTARVFNATAAYTFNLSSAGGYFLRLHFCPLPSAGLGANSSEFEVTADGLKLLARCNVTAEVERKRAYLQSLGINSTAPFLVKEYFLNASSGTISLQFSPSPGFVAYISAVELVPAPDSLFSDSAARIGRGIEMMYRVNMGDREVEAWRDWGLWRSWETDIKYMFSSLAAKTISNSSSIAYADGNRTAIAPLLVYEDARTMVNDDVVEKRFNVTWKFAVDPGFDYLVRLHFCELVYDTANQRVFRIYLNFRVAADDYDVLARAGGKGRAYCQDLVNMAPEGGTLWLQLGQDAATGATDTDVLLNGLEVFKLGRNGNLAFVPDPERTGGGGGGGAAGGPAKAGGGGNSHWVRIGAGIGSTAAVAIVGALGLVLCARARRGGKAPPPPGVKGGAGNAAPPAWRPLVLDGEATVGSTASAARAAPANGGSGSGASSRTGRRFAVAEIRAATRNFDEALVIGTGGFGKVYRGELEDGRPVAVKRAHPQSEQGMAEFETEIAMLSRLRHRHLVSMIGYCDEQGEMILVYEYMAKGTLRSHLYGDGAGGEEGLPWRRRLEACIGAARGLHYLHTGAERGIIHRDVKTTNILLDEELAAKVADFGLSKDGPAVDRTHVSTAVKGSFGYLDPEYFRRQQLTQKSDVYSFGVVLFEVVCARPAVNPTLPKDQINLAEWAARWQRQGQLAAVADPRLRGDCSPESLHAFGEIALKCLADEGRRRPTMGEVLWHLEYALQLHDTFLQSGGGAASSQAAAAEGSN